MPTTTPPRLVIQSMAEIATEPDDSHPRTANRTRKALQGLEDLPVSGPNDVVVTVPQGRWLQWLAEGDLPGDPPEESASWDFYLGAGLPRTTGPGSRCYVVAHGMLRGYAPLVEVVRQGRGGSLVRGGGAVAITLYPKEGPAIPLKIQGFRGFLSRWWAREDEVPFHDFATLGLPPQFEREVREMLAARARSPKVRAALRAWALGTPVDSIPLSAADQILEDAQAADRARRFAKVLADPKSTVAERDHAEKILATTARRIADERRPHDPRLPEDRAALEVKVAAAIACGVSIRATAVAQ